MEKSCQQCVHWIKLKYGFKGKGICDLTDMGWIPSDYKAIDCKHYKRKRYKR